MWSPLPPTSHIVTMFLVLQVRTGKAFIRAIGSPNSTSQDFGGLPAIFGPPLPTGGLIGFLVEARPANACHPIEGPPNASSAFIALIRRHDCPFVTKILHAQRAGYRAAIVHNVDSQVLVSMVSEVDTKQQIQIPSMFTTDVASRILKRLCRSRKLTSVILIPEYFHFTWKATSGTSFSSSSYPCQCRIQLPGPCSQTESLHTCCIICIPVSAVIASLLIEKYLSRCKKWKEKNKFPQESEEEPPGISFTSSKYQECAICLEKYLEYDSLKVLSCSHAFHSKCIDLWHITQTRSKTCPLCMQKVMVVTRLQAMRLWKEGTRENRKNRAFWLSKTEPICDKRPWLWLSQRFSSQF